MANSESRRPGPASPLQREAAGPSSAASGRNERPRLGPLPARLYGSSSGLRCGVMAAHLKKRVYEEFTKVVQVTRAFWARMDGSRCSAAGGAGGEAELWGNPPAQPGAEPRSAARPPGVGAGAAPEGSGRSGTGQPRV